MHYYAHLLSIIANGVSEQSAWLEMKEETEETIISETDNPT